MEPAQPVGPRPVDPRPVGLWAPQWRGLLAGLVLTITLVAFEALAVITILPVVAHDLDGLRLYGWVTSAFFLGTVVGIVVAGEQTDRHGPAPPFVLGLALFAGGLTLGGLAPSMAVLVAGRGLQGLGAGAVPAIAYVSIGRTFPEALRPRVFAVLSTAWVVPGAAAPALSALVAERAGWRAVFLGLLPLVGFAGGLSVRALRRIGPPKAATAGERRLPTALRVSAGAGLLLIGLSIPSFMAVPLVAAGLALGLRPLLALLPAGTLRARAGLPATVLSRGLVTFAFFGADSYVPLALTSVRQTSTTVAGVAVTAATMAWTAAAWTQERLAPVWTGRKLVTVGLCALVLGIAGFASGLLPAVPLPLVLGAWATAGFGIGLSYAPLSLMVLRSAPAARQGTATAALQLSDNLGVALGAGCGGVAVAAGAAAGWAPRVGLAIAFGLTALVALGGLGVARRLPSATAPRRA